MAMHRSRLPTSFFRHRPAPPIPLSTMWAPAPANARAHPRPIPLVEPVHNGRLALQDTQFTLLLCLSHAFIFDRPDSSRGLRGDVGLAVGGSRARPCPAR